MLGKVEGRWKRWYREWVDDSIDSMDTSLSKLRKITNAREAWCAAVHGVTELDTTEGLNTTKGASHD